VEGPPSDSDLATFVEEDKGLPIREEWEDLVPSPKVATPSRR